MTTILKQTKLEPLKERRKHYLRLPAKTDILKFSFLLNTFKDLNLLPQDIINKIQSAEEPAKLFADVLDQDQDQCRFQMCG
jgi:hypothetical protein